MCTSHHIPVLSLLMGCPNLAAGAPVIAYSAGQYPAGTEDSDLESTGKAKGSKGLKRSLTEVSSPQKTPESKKPEVFLQDAQDPNETQGTATPPPLPGASTRHPANGAMPPPSAPSEAKDALYWKSFSLTWVSCMTILQLDECIRPFACYLSFLSPNYQLRLRRHCVIKKASASEDAVKLWKTKDGRNLTSETPKKCGQ